MKVNCHNWGYKHSPNSQQLEDLISNAYGLSSTMTSFWKTTIFLFITVLIFESESINPHVYQGAGLPPRRDFESSKWLSNRAMDVWYGNRTMIEVLSSEFSNMLMKLTGRTGGNTNDITINYSSAVLPSARLLLIEAWFRAFHDINKLSNIKIIILFESVVSEISQQTLQLFISKIYLYLPSLTFKMPFLCNWLLCNVALVRCSHSLGNKKCQSYLYLAVLHFWDWTIKIN